MSERRWSAALLGVAMSLGGCRARLPAEPPGRDATEADATIPTWSPPPDATRTSAFAGERLEASGHAHHGHGAAATPEVGPKPEAEAK